MWTRWGTLATIPRISLVSCRSTVWLRRLSPSPATPANAFAVGATLSPGATRFAGLAGLAGLADFAGFAGALVAWLAVFFPEAFLVVALGLGPAQLSLRSSCPPPSHTSR